MLGVGGGGPVGAEAAAAVPPGTRPPGRLSERESLIVLSTVDGVGPMTIARLVGAFGSATDVLDAASAPRGASALVAATRVEDDPGRAMSLAVAEALVDAAGRCRQILAELDSTGLTILTVEDTAYPPRLRAIDLPPHVIYVRGNAAALQTPAAVAIVGTRRPSEAGRLVAARIAAALTAVGAVVVSGLAVGIDGAAHAAVVAARGRTVGVLGGGLDQLFPRAHVALAREIVASGGALVSELPPAASPVPGTFPRRNRVISGLSQATIVVEAGASSGALITASWALEQGRECFAVPGPIDSPTSAGCLALLREFPGQVRIVAGIPQLIADLEIELPQTVGQPALAVPVEAVLGALGAGPRRIAAELLAGRSTADELVAATGFTIAGVLGALTLLESRGLVAGVYGRYRAVGQLASAATVR